MSYLLRTTSIWHQRYVIWLHSMRRRRALQWHHMRAMPSKLIDCLFNSMFRLQANNTSKLTFNKGKTPVRTFPYKGPVMRNRFPFRDFFHGYIYANEYIYIHCNCMKPQLYTVKLLCSRIIVINPQRTLMSDLWSVFVSSKADIF